MPGFKIYTSNKADILAEKLSETLRENPLSPLEKETVIVQSQGMEHWLRLRIAAANGISANIDFPFPKAFIYGIFKEIEDLPEISPFSPEAMTWTLMKILPEHLENRGFEILKNYLDGDRNGIKSYQLCSRIAGLFDQYQIYRPDIIMIWNSGGIMPEDFQHAIWQSELWRQISSENSPVDQASLKNNLIIKLNDGFLLKTLAPRISIFGISTLPPYYIEIFEALSSQTEINFFYLNPCMEFWGDGLSAKGIEYLKTLGAPDEDLHLETGNPLLSSMGKSGMEFFNSLLNGAAENVWEEFTGPGTDRMLSCIQSDILNLRNRKSGEKAVLTPGDRSIQVHSCHSPLRELEILYDNLLDTFENSPGILPSEIAVMMPDISKYAPLIEAVFDNPENEKLRIPWSIADRNIIETGRLAETLLQFLETVQGRFCASDVLDLLSSEIIRSKFDFSSDDMDRIRTWISETRIRWGADADFRVELGFPGFSENTWRHGLDRMLLGYAAAGQENKFLFQSISPYDRIEGDSSKTLGSLAKFLDMLFHHSRAVKGRNSLKDWAQLLCRIVDDISDRADEEAVQIRKIFSSEGLLKFSEISNFKDEISIDVVITYIRNAFGKIPQGRAFIRGGVVFCTMLPMRNIPFKVIYLLGMNCRDYPGNSLKTGFDMMEKKRRPCDHSRRLSDKYLFLEAILAAEKKLVISYIGQNIRDNSEIPPSSLVEELRDYIRESFISEGEDILIKHPLQPFSPTYFEKDTGLFSYSRGNFDAARKTIEKKRVKKFFISSPISGPLPEKHSNVSLRNLSRFFKSPSEYFLKNRLRIYLEDRDMIEIGDTEPFALDGLDKYLIRENILQALLSGKGPDECRRMIMAEGVLPHGQSGEAEYIALENEITGFHENLKGFIDGGKMPIREFEFQHEGIRLYGRLENIFAKGQIFFKSSRMKTADRLHAWIHHLALSCMKSKEEKTYCVSQNETLEYPGIKASEAESELKKLIVFYRNGMSFPLKFFPEISWEALSSNDDVSALEKAMKKWNANPRFSYSLESEDEYIVLCFGDETVPIDGEFLHVSREILGELVNRAKTAGGNADE
ncbi:MAG: exodeoxyribonuclease V subunit gamma [Lentisphaerae bacterium GWF2_44_16]|nr:MAG: exodeoxyribonuclease V subunit gamma [Lentisphaerae bacterium GWF2_44_16]